MCFSRRQYPGSINFEVVRLSGRVFCMPLSLVPGKALTAGINETTGGVPTRG
jgi:hypothetical protein